MSSRRGHVPTWHKSAHHSSIVAAIPTYSFASISFEIGRSNSAAGMAIPGFVITRTTSAPNDAPNSPIFDTLAWYTGALNVGHLIDFVEFRAFAAAIWSRSACMVVELHVCLDAQSGSRGRQALRPLRPRVATPWSAVTSRPVSMGPTRALRAMRLARSSVVSYAPPERSTYRYHAAV